MSRAARPDRPVPGSGDAHLLLVSAFITDPEQLANDRAATATKFEGHDVTVAGVSTNEAEVVEGAPVGLGLVAVRFRGAATFPAWYDSLTYQAIIGMRAGGTQGSRVAGTRESRDGPSELTIGTTRLGWLLFRGWLPVGLVAAIVASRQLEDHPGHDRHRHGAPSRRA